MEIDQNYKIGEHDACVLRGCVIATQKNLFVPFSCRIGFRPTLASCAVDKQHNGGESKPGRSDIWDPYRPSGAD